jgi:hypothetical protein
MKYEFATECDDCGFYYYQDANPDKLTSDRRAKIKWSAKLDIRDNGIYYISINVHSMDLVYDEEDINSYEEKQREFVVNMDRWTIKTDTESMSTFSELQLIPRSVDVDWRKSKIEIYF